MPCGVIVLGLFKALGSRIQGFGGSSFLRRIGGSGSVPRRQPLRSLRKRLRPQNGPKPPTSEALTPLRPKALAPKP